MNKTPTFSTARKLSLSLNVALSVLSALAIVIMVNYVAARHFLRLSVSEHGRIELSPRTLRVLDSLTNELKVIIYFKKDEALYDSTEALLKEYKFRNPKISVETIDYERDPGAATLCKKKYELNKLSNKNVVIFDCPGRPPPRVVYDSELSEYDIKPLMNGQSQEVRRTHFKGEMMFTSAILGLINAQPWKAYILQGHGEHAPESDDELMGYSKFVSVLKDNTIQAETLTLHGTNEVPGDCSLLIIPGPTDALLNEELDKIERYLKQGGRMLVLFKPAIYTPGREVGLEKVLANWGVTVGNDVVIDRQRAVSVGQQDMVVRNFGNHPLIRSLYNSGIYMVLPRSVAKIRSRSTSGADALQVEELAKTSPEGRILTDLRKDGAYYKSATDTIGEVPLMAAVEKGSIRGVRADRGSTRLVVIGNSLFLNNRSINSAANREFLSQALNWLLARDELVGAVGPRPIKEYKLVMSQSQLKTVRWILMLGFPGSVLLVGLVVSLRRRR